MLIARSPKLRLRLVRSFVRQSRRTEKHQRHIFPSRSSFGPSVSQSVSQSFSQPASRFHYLGRSFPRASVRPVARLHCTGLAPEASPALSLSHPKLHVQFHLQDETLT